MLDLLVIYFVETEEIKYDPRLHV